MTPKDQQKKKKKKLETIRKSSSMAALAACFPLALLAADGVKDVDNSHMNLEKGTTAQDQSFAERDIELTRAIRKEIVADDSLSTNAKNVKVISNKGHVVLEGPVSTVREKERVEEIARTIAGRPNYTSRLSVKNN